jgi:hypothetical protein
MDDCAAPQSSRSRWLVALILLLMAGALRFYKLGAWPFADDELATLAEEAAFFAPSQVPPDSQIYRLSRAVPLGYLIAHAGHLLCGRDEYGSRVLMAVCGTLGVVVVFLLLDGLLGRTTALAASLLITMWPEHLFQSQQTRFYIVAALFASLCLLAGALAAQHRSARYSALACCLALAAMLCHTLLVGLLGVVLAGVVAAAIAQRQPLPHSVWAVFAGAVLVAAGLLLGYVWPLLRGWNQGETWGYTSAHALLAAVNSLGWPLALLAALGLLHLARERTAQSWYWITCAMAWGGAALVLPRIVTYHPAYIFPLALGPLVLAAAAVALIATRLRPTSPLLAAAWIGVACLFSLPSVVSHFADGSRPDLRTAARYVDAHWQVGDRLTGFSMGTVGHYAPRCRPTIPLWPTSSASQLQTLAAEHGRLWIVVESARSGLPEELRRWLGTHAAAELTVRGKRYDYAENRVDVFLCTAH